MIRHISGKIAHTSNTAVVVDVSGVGYLVHVSSPTSFKLEQTVKFHTHHAIRETASDLYGFITLDELEIFELLLTLPKIGPKSAAQILGQADIELLKTAVLNNDPSHLSKMAGIGKKTAEKVVVGLKDKFEDLGMALAGSESSNLTTQSFQTDAIDALISLGYPQSEARKVVQQLPPDIINANDAVRESLKELGKS